MGKDEVIYGHVGLYRRAALLSNMIYFFELVLPWKKWSQNEGFGLRPKDESISTPGAKFQ
jgi:hypothetical protein